MKIYKISQNVNNGYDTYDSAVVCAENEEEARNIHPSKYITHFRDDKWYGTNINGEEYDYEGLYSAWVERKDIGKIIVEEIGEANEEQKKGIILSSFNAG